MTTNKNYWLTALFILSFLPLGTLQAQIPSGEANDLIYRSLGPTRGGRVTAVAGHVSHPFTFYFGSTGGGVWKTNDAGTTWSNISDSYFDVGSIGAIVVAPSDPNVLYVGTGSADPRGNVSPGKGMYKSTDRGESWMKIGLEKAGQIGAIQVHPSDPEVVFVAALGNVFGANTERGIYRSLNGGKTWERVHFVSPKTGAIDLVMDPNNSRVLYAGFWTVERKPWTLIDGSEEGGVWKSVDGGDSWNRLEGGLPSGLQGRVGVTVSPANSKKVWVIQETADEKKGGIYRSDDGGKTFSRVNRDHEFRQRHWYYNRIFAHPTDENTVFVVNVGFHKSIDGGKSFSRLRTPHGDNHALWINPENPNIMIEGNDGGACVTLNGGETWSSQNNQPTAEFYRIAVDNQWPYRVYGAQQDNSTMSVSSMPQADLMATQDWYSVGGGESGHIAVDPRDPDIIYAGNYIGQITRFDRSKWHKRDVVAYPQMHDGTAPRDIKYRFQWNAPIRISPHNPDVVYHCSQYVHRTQNGGRTWTVISPDLTTNNDAYQDIPGGPIQHDHTGVELYTTIFSFEESPLVAGELWAGSDDGLLHISRDNGVSWTDITPVDMPKGGTINTIDISKHAPGRAFITVYRYRENDYRPYVFHTDNYGANWSLLTNGENGIPADHFLRVVREDPVRKGLLFAGSEYGMFISFDTGKSWAAFQQNLPVSPITDMLIVENDIVLSTQGRAFWKMENIDPLRVLTDTLRARSAYLLKPATAYRTQMRNYRGAGPDPARLGATIDFYLKEESDSELRLSIIDPKGKERVVLSTAADRKAGERPLAVHQGLNRVQWSLTYERPEVLDDAVFSLANTGGIKAMMGTHQVKLMLDGQEQVQSLEVKPDPRWTQTEADLQAQYELAMQASSLLSRCHQIIKEIRTLRIQLREVNEKLHAYQEPVPSFDAIAKQVANQLDDLEAKLKQNKSESGQDPINYPSMIDDQMAYLYSIINGQDGRPTAGAYQRLEDLKEEFEEYDKQFMVIKQREVPQMNQMLEKSRMNPIEVTYKKD